MNHRAVTRLLSPRLLSIVLTTLAVTAAAHATQVALIGDASVSTARPSTNFGSLANLYVGNGNTAFLQFDLSTLPAGLTASQISHATLTVFVNRVNGIGLVTLAPVTSAWAESSVTAATAPSIGASAGLFTASVAGEYVTLDVTSLVQGWVTTPATNFGFALTSGSANLLLDSKENDETGHAASLDITITSTGATGPQGPAGPQGIQGVPGTQGPQGVPGPTGVNGAPGPIGLTGATGATGPVGPIGATGAAGPTGTFSQEGNWSASTTYQVGQIVFCAACSTNGSSYVALATNTNQDPPTQTAVWGLVAKAGAIGPAGPTGATGAIGLTGPAGAIGPAGPTGATGVAGPVGPAGATGTTGSTGPAGVPGPAGPTGATGTLSAVTNWSSTVVYETGQVIFCAACSTNGSSYIALTSNQSVDPPTHLATWQLIAQAGATGATGTTGAIGATGSTGAAGPQGPQGNPGVNGTDGTNGTGSVTSVTVGSVSNTAATGAGTLTISNTTTTPTISINFPNAAAGGSGGNLAYGGTATNGDVLTTTQSSFYLATDQGSFTLPDATTAGQQLIIADNAPTNGTSMFTVNTISGTKINDAASQSANLTTFTAETYIDMVSDGAGHWWVITSF